ncbi:MAG: hypothetical protein N3A54_02815 [Patescibacteria group bacterium]|nr:hypothetical protein [Patescibacteria group bacterium]
MKKFSKQRLYLFLLFFSLLIVFVFIFYNSRSYAGETDRDESSLGWWNIRSVDTMKLSRDLAREKMHDASFDAVISTQVEAAKELGATHVAIGTPYDDEFLPFLERWVKKIREQRLHVWFRGNFAGWEEWFGYKRITREDHKKKLQRFILNNQFLFEDGDLFTSCPECENGGPGDPRMTGDVEGFRKFLIDEYAIAKKSFETIGKKVQANVYSMNGDVALLVMDEQTTQALDGIITIDHYVKSPKRMKEDLTLYTQKSKGRIVIGEFGLPIPDIHGKLSEEQQAKLLYEFFDVFVRDKNVVGVNYWVLTGGSTEILRIDGTKRKGFDALKVFYRPLEAFGYVHDELGESLPDVLIITSHGSTKTDQRGYFRIPILYEGEIATISGNFIQQQTINLVSGEDANTVTVAYVNETFLFKFIKLLRKNFPFFFSRFMENPR